MGFIVVLWFILTKRIIRMVLRVDRLREDVWIWWTHCNASPWVHNSKLFLNICIYQKLISCRLVCIPHFSFGLPVGFF